MYAFGHGLSYTTFEYCDLEVEGGDTMTATSEGARTIAVGRNARDVVLDAKATLGERHFGR